MIEINRLDHLVLRVKSIPAACGFYSKALGMEEQRFNSPALPEQERFALKFGNQKINLHQQGAEFEPYAHKPLPGSANLCFIIGLQSFAEVTKALAAAGVVLELGPIATTGANGAMLSVYVRDPDENLIELAQYK